MPGLTDDEEKLLGPVHVYVALGTLLVDKFNVLPAHNGELLLMDGVAGLEPTVIFTESVLEQPVAVIVSVNL